MGGNSKDKTSYMKCGCEQEQLLGGVMGSREHLHQKSPEPSSHKSPGAGGWPGKGCALNWSIGLAPLPAGFVEALPGTNSSL